MGIAEFAPILTIGLGRAILHLREHDAAPYRKAILHACLHSMVYDRQTEHSREQYLFDIINLTGERDFYRSHILATAASLTEVEDGDQILGLVRSFAAQGDAEARRQLYDTFAANAATDKPDGAHYLVELDGTAALLVVAERLPLEPDDAWYPGYLVGLAAEREGEEATERALAEAAATSAPGAAFVAAVRQERARQHARAEERRWRRDVVESYDRIRQLLRENHPDAPGLLWQWGRQATDAELALAAADLLTEEEPRRLLALARDTNPQTAALAIGALAKIEHPDIRALAFELLAGGQGQGAQLLVGNYQGGDFALIEELLTAWQDRDQIHSLGFALRDLAKAHPSPDAVEALLLLYERGPCSLCRHDVVESLEALGALPDWMVVECRHDANPDLREAMRERGDAPDLASPTV